MSLAAALGLAAFTGAFRLVPDLGLAAVFAFLGPDDAAGDTGEAVAATAGVSMTSGAAVSEMVLSFCFN